MLIAISIIIAVLAFLAIFIGVPLILGHIRDIRTIFVRLAAYAGLIIVFTAFYLIMFFLIYRYLFKVEISDWDIFIFNSLMIVIFLILFPTINEINYYLNHIFYFDNYDTTSLVRRITKLVSSSSAHDPEYLFKRASATINLALGTTFVGFVIRPDEINESIISTPNRRISLEDAKALTSYANVLPGQVAQIDPVSEYDSINAVLHKHSIAMLIPLRAKTNEQLLGVIAIGRRRHHRPFSQKDIESLTIIADMLLVTLTNIIYYRHIESFNQELQEKLAIATAKLSNVNKSLSNLNKLKSEFLRLASRQLKIPLATAHGYLSMLLDGDAGRITARQRVFVDNALVASGNMTRVIDKFMAILMIENRQTFIDLRETDFADILREEINRVQNLAQDRGIVIKTRITDVPLVSKLDEYFIKRAVNFLFENAIVYSAPNQKKILVSVEAAADELVFQVTDSGLVPTRSEQRKISHRFYRTKKARRLYPDGTGVGLYLAHQIILAHHGQMLTHFTKTTSTFGFALPLSKSPILSKTPNRRPKSTRNA